MSRVDAALRRARAEKAGGEWSTSKPAVDWLDLTPAVHPSSWDLERLPSEVVAIERPPEAPADGETSARTESASPAGDGQTPDLRASAAGQPETSAPATFPPRVPIFQDPLNGPPVALEPRADEAGADVGRTAEGDVERMFEALDRVLGESPLSSARRTASTQASVSPQKPPLDPPVAPKTIASESDADERSRQPASTRSRTLRFFE